MSLPITGVAALPLGLLFGFAFGWLLQRGRVANANVIINQFRLRDFTVIKVMLTAIVVPGIVFAAPGVLRIDIGNIKLIAALVAVIVAWRWRNTMLTIAVGMVSLWLLQRFVS